MKLRIFTEPQQGADYATLRNLALAAEALGFDAFFRSDHYLRIGTIPGQPANGLPGLRQSGSAPTDAWVTLAGLAVETSRIRLGTLMSAATFRLPGPLAIAVAQVDQMSDGRVEFGIGTGWYDAEHAAFGIPLPTLDERFGRLEEQLAIITGLWARRDGQRFSFDGAYYSLIDSPGLPVCVQQPSPPVLLGGVGTRRTPRLAARFADEFNIPFKTVKASAEAFARVRDACEASGRDPRSMFFSASQVVCCGEDERAFRRRAMVIGREPEELRRHGLTGTPREVIARIDEFAGIGTDRIYLQVLDLEDLDHLRLIAREVAPYV